MQVRAEVRKSSGRDYLPDLRKESHDSLSSVRIDEESKDEEGPANSFRISRFSRETNRRLELASRGVDVAFCLFDESENRSRP